MFVNLDISGAHLMQDAKKAPLSYMRKPKNEESWKQLDNEILDPIADKLTDALDYFTPERKELGRKPSSESEEDKYFEELSKKRKARYEALKEKYKD